MIEDEGREDEGRVLSVRFGRSANCSSVGSIVDVLFVSSVVGTALMGALAVMLRGRDDEGAGREENGDEDPPDPS